MSKFFSTDQFESSNHRMIRVDNNPLIRTRKPTEDEPNLYGIIFESLQPIPFIDPQTNIIDYGLQFLPIFWSRSHLSRIKTALTELNYHEVSQPDLDQFVFIYVPAIAGIDWFRDEIKDELNDQTHIRYEFMLEVEYPRYPAINCTFSGCAQKGVLALRDRLKKDGNRENRNSV